MFWLNTESELYLVEEAIEQTDGVFPDSPVVHLPNEPMKGVRVWSLVREVRFHTPRGQKNQNKKQKQYCNKLNEDSKNGPQQNKIFKLVEEILKTKLRDSKIKKKKKKLTQFSLSQTCGQ